MGDDDKAPAAPGFSIPKPVIYGVLGFVGAFGLVVLTIFLSLRPSKPSFTIQDITVSSFNVSTTQPYRLSTNMQVTISSRNTMSRVAIIYGEMELYATYRNEQITFRYSLPVTYQEHNEFVVWSPYLEGHVAAISPISGPVLMQDLNYGAVLVIIKIEGRLKFRVGAWTSVYYRLYGHCPAMIQLGDMDTKKDFAVSAKEFKFLLVQNCHVEIAR
ncbi:NDR1/HIN1-like protein 1 [Rosa sericea]